MIKRCERCSDETHFLEKCTFCGKYICRNCLHTAKNLEKIKRVVICKGCFGDAKKIKEYDSMK